MKELKKMLQKDAVPATLRVAFGNDQLRAVEVLLDEMTGEGRILSVDRQPDDGNELTLYVIKFDDAYSCYVFGHRQADLMKYLMKSF